MCFEGGGKKVDEVCKSRQLVREDLISESSSSTCRSKRHEINVAYYQTASSLHLASHNCDML